MEVRRLVIVSTTVLLAAVLATPTHGQTDEDDQFRDGVLDQLKQIFDKVNILEQKYDQLAGQLKVAIGKIASLEAGARQNPTPPAVTTSPVPSSGQSNCPSDIGPSAPCTWVDKFGCYCIFSSANARTFSAARKHCKDHQMDLVAIESAEEQLVLNRLLRTKVHDWPFWTSGSDEEVEGVWKWMATGESLKYTNWQEGQPDNDGNIQHVLMLMKNEPFKWFDGMKRQNGELGANYICEL